METVHTRQIILIEWNVFVIPIGQDKHLIEPFERVFESLLLLNWLYIESYMISMGTKLV